MSFSCQGPVEFVHVAHVCDTPQVPDDREDLYALAGCCESPTSDFFFSIKFSAHVTDN